MASTAATVPTKNKQAIRKTFPLIARIKDAKLQECRSQSMVHCL